MSRLTIILLFGGMLNQTLDRFACQFVYAFHFRVFGEELLNKP